MLSRVLAVLAALCLVVAFALATVLPPLTSVRDVLADLDQPGFVALVHTGEAGLPSWFWAHGVVPLLLRPAWLPPTGLGLILMALAVTIGSHKGVARSHRRRS